ncbi:MAG: glycosyltransferase family 39 protein [Candidatus Dojkabacteria bacterium]
MNVLERIKSISTYKQSSLLRDNQHFIIASVLIIISLLIFFPSFYTTTDEHDYIENSYLIGQGRLVKEDKQCFDGASCGYFNGSGYISKYNPGLSLILLPFVAIDWRISFFISVVVFILALYIFKRLLEKRSVRAEFIYLFAFFPVFVYYSRKVMTEVYTLTLIMLIFYLLFEKSEGRTKLRQIIYNYRFVLVGALSGITVLIKYTNILFIAPILIYWAVIYFKPKIIGNVGESIFLGTETLKVCAMRWLKDVIRLLVGAVPFLVIFLVFNYAFYGSPLRSGYYFSKEELLIVPSLIIPQGIKYLVILLSIYPGLLFVGFFAKYKHRFLIMGTLFLSILFFVGFPGYAFNSGILDFIVGIRFLIPILGLVLLVYSEALDRLLNKIKYKGLVNVVFAVVVIVLIANMFVMTYIFNGRVKELASKSAEIYKTVEEDGNYYTKDIEERKLINEAFKQGKRWLFIN